jgi:hypothetical protein
MGAWTSRDVSKLEKRFARGRPASGSGPLIEADPEMVVTKPDTTEVLQLRLAPAHRAEAAAVDQEVGGESQGYAAPLQQPAVAQEVLTVTCLAARALAAGEPATERAEGEAAALVCAQESFCH